MVKGSRVKKPIMALGVAVICLPLLFSLWLLAAVEWPRMDAVTRHLPMGLRGLVAHSIVMREPAGRPDADGRRRSESLDFAAARSAEAEQLTLVDMHTLSDTQTPLNAKIPHTPAKLQELYAQQIAGRKAARELSKKATATELAGDACAAEELYAEASSKDSGPEIYEYTEGVGRSGVRCGDLPGARAGLETAVMVESNFIKGTDEDALMNVRDDLRKDREYMVVLYNMQHERGLAQQACAAAHPGWRACSCKLAPKTGVSCVEAR